MDSLNKSCWNELVKFKNATENQKLKEQAEMLLRQRNTAGGFVIEPEMRLFLELNEKPAN